MKINFKNLILFIFFSVVGIFCAGFVFFVYNYKIEIKPENLKKLCIFDRNGKILKLKSEKKCKISYVPESLINAFVAIEDNKFFEHRGISFTGIIRSIIKNIISRRLSQGASTITQQYIKLRDGNLKKTFSRKIKEQFKAIILESNYTKKEILQEYFNIIYFGSGIVGISQAANAFWNKSYKDLDVLESATLAGIVQLPEKYNPLKNIEFCKKRRNLVLKKLYEAKKITKENYEFYLKQGIILNPSYTFNYEKNILYMIKRFIKENKIESDSYYISTTFDNKIQKIVTEIVYSKLSNLRKNFLDIEAGLTLLDVKTGQVLATINGVFDFQEGRLRSTDIKRQIGSTIKPLISYFAFQNGDDKDTIYIDEPIESLGNWHPRNNNRIFKGEMTLEEALISSNNIVPVKILMKHGLNNFNIFLNDLKIINSNDPLYSLALGCIEANTLNLAAIYSAFCNDGKIYMPYFIKSVRNFSENIIYRNDLKLIYSFDQNNLKKVREILEKNAQKICLKLNKKYIKGLVAKTGTTNDVRTCWFVGATEKYAIALYIGADNNESMSKYNVSSIRNASEIGISILNEINFL